ncbi:hypothetical protein [Streptomyces sp. NPDC048560]|uniref:hypothetical protein n=1 Tax=Streptomyces sp. NPDC048560 TaxID=3155488 RepID=UPI00343923DF
MEYAIRNRDAHGTVRARAESRPGEGRKQVLRAVPFLDLGPDPGSALTRCSAVDNDAAHGPVAPTR